MNSSVSNLPRPFSRSSYYKLKELFRISTEDYLVFLETVNSELNHREKAWPLELRNEICQQIELVRKQFEQAMRRLP